MELIIFLLADFHLIRDIKVSSFRDAVKFNGWRERCTALDTPSICEVRDFNTQGSLFKQLGFKES